MTRLDHLIRLGVLRTSYERELRDLNEQHVRAFMTADVAWFQEHLADDFVCIAPDGAIFDKAEFLRNSARGPQVTEFKLAEVDVQIVGASGEVALIRATGLFTRPDGTTGTSRYVDIYERRAGTWRAVSAQTTRRAG